MRGHSKSFNYYGVVQPQTAGMPPMYSSEDLERFYFDYQTEWMPRGMSIQAYCSRNNVPYKVLEKWIRDIYKRVVPVQIAGAPEELKIENPRPTETAPKKKTSNEDVSIKINIVTSYGMKLSRDGLDYRNLRTYIERLEGLLC